MNITPRGQPRPFSAHIFDPDQSSPQTFTPSTRRAIGPPPQQPPTTRAATAPPLPSGHHNPGHSVLFDQRTLPPARRRSADIADRRANAATALPLTTIHNRSQQPTSDVQALVTTSMHSCPLTHRKNIFLMLYKKTPAHEPIQLNQNFFVAHVSINSFCG